MSSLAVQSAAAHKARAGNKCRVSFCADLQNAGPPPDCIGCRVRAKAEPLTAPNKPRLSSRRDWHAEAWPGCRPDSCPSLRPSHLTHPGVQEHRASRMRGSQQRPGPLHEVLPRRPSRMHDSKHAEPVKTSAVGRLTRPCPSSRVPLTWPILRSA